MSVEFHRLLSDLRKIERLTHGLIPEAAEIAAEALKDAGHEPTELPEAKGVWTVEALDERTAFIQRDGFDLIKIERLTGELVEGHKSEPDYRPVTDDDFQQVLDNIAKAVGLTNVQNKVAAEIIAERQNPKEANEQRLLVMLKRITDLYAEKLAKDGYDPEAVATGQVGRARELISELTVQS